jgi:hypothetical protein
MRQNGRVHMIAAGAVDGNRVREHTIRAPAQFYETIQIIRRRILRIPLLPVLCGITESNSAQHGRIYRHKREWHHGTTEFLAWTPAQLDMPQIQRRTTAGGRGADDYGCRYPTK